MRDAAFGVTHGLGGTCAARLVTRLRCREWCATCLAGCFLLFLGADHFGLLFGCRLLLLHEPGEVEVLTLGCELAGEWVLRLVLRQGMQLVGAGIGVGVVLAMVSTRLIRSMLWGVGATDLVTYGAVAGLLVAVTLLANLVPALRVTRVDPLIAMRDEY